MRKKAITPQGKIQNTQTYSGMAINLAMQGVTRLQLDFTQACISDGEYIANGKVYRTNDFPQYYSKAVLGSPTARACYRVVSEFLKGKGFTNELLNKNKTFLDTFRNVCADYSLLYRFGIKIKYAFLGESHVIESFEWVEVEALRYGIPDKNGVVRTVIYNPFFNSSEETQRAMWREYPLFDFENAPNDLLLFLERNQRCSEDDFCQVLFFNETSPLSRHYSRPDAYSAEHAILTEGLVWQFHENNVVNNGYAGGIITLIGDPNECVEADEITGECLVTAKEAFEKEMQQTVVGTDNAGKFLTIWVKGNNPVLPTIAPFENSSENETRFIELMPELKDTISNAFGVPQVLANIQVAGKLGNTKEYEFATKILNAKIKSMQEVLERTFTMLFLYSDLTLEVEIIQISRFLGELEPFLFDALTPDQKAEYLEKNYGITRTTNDTTNIERKP